MHKRNKKILIGVGAVVGVLVMVYGIALVRSSLKLRAAYAALEKEGRPMVAADLVPPLVPDDQNAASFYLYAADVLKQQAVTRKKTLLDHAADLAFSFMGDAFEPERRAELEALMTQEHVSSALAALEQGLQCPACRFDHDYDNGLHADGFESRDLRLLARLWGARACLEAEAGRTPQAWNMVRTQFRCADALSDMPAVGGHFSRLGIIGDLCHIVRKLYEIAPPSEEDYREIEALLADHVDLAPLVYAVDAERVLRGEWLFTRPQGQLYEALRRDDQSLLGHGGPEVFARLVFRVIAFRPRFVADHAAYLQMMRNGVQLIEGPYAPPGSDVEEEFRGLAHRSLLTSQLAPGIVFGKKVHCGVVAKVHVTRAGLALLQYRKTHGMFPPSLDALGLENLIDPFIEAPLHYRTEAEGFVIYSVGEDQKDNGGTPRRPLDTSGRRPKIPEYDLLWRFPRATGQAAGSGT
jgi:hypothetical protein